MNISVKAQFGWAVLPHAFNKNNELSIKITETLKSSNTNEGSCPKL